MANKAEEIIGRLRKAEILSRGKILGMPLQIHKDLNFLARENQEMRVLIRDAQVFIEGAMATLHANTRLWELGKDLLTRLEKKGEEE